MGGCMNKFKISFCKSGSIMLCFFLVFMLFSVPTMAKQAEAKNETVEVGWFEDSYNIIGENGELDLMSGVSYTEERAQKMLFSELPMGEERYYLYADVSNTDISASNLKTLNDKRVGLFSGFFPYF